MCPTGTGRYRYVSDNIFTFIHNGPGTQYRILGSVKAGEPLDVKAVNNEAGFTQVVDGRGREGWIKSSELQGEISLRERLPQVQKSWKRPGPPAEPQR